MEFKYSLSILFSNMGFVLKVLLWVVICALVVAAIGCAVLIPTVNALADDGAVNEAYGAIGDDVSAFLDGSASAGDFLHDVAADFDALLSAVLASQGLLTALIFIMIAMYILYVFLVGVCYYPIAYAANQMMSSNMHIGLASSMAMNLKKAVRFSAARLTVTVPVDAVIAAITACIAFGLWDVIGFFSLTIALAFGVFAFSARSTLVAGWLPRLLFNKEENVYTAFSRSLRGVKLNLKGLLKAFVITYFATYMLVATCAVPTFGLIAIVVPSINYFLVRLIELVGYYKMNGMSFYTDAITVVDTVEFGYRSENQQRADDENLAAYYGDYAAEASLEKREEQERERFDAPRADDAAKADDGKDAEADGAADGEDGK